HCVPAIHAEAALTGPRKLRLNEGLFVAERTGAAQGVCCTIGHRRDAVVLAWPQLLVSQSQHSRIEQPALTLRVRPRWVQEWHSNDVVATVCHAHYFLFDQQLFLRAPGLRPPIEQRDGHTRGQD
ncbi:hypothetical protein BaRGS_00008711, partial [Batillaria attramentaria]